MPGDHYTILHTLFIHISLHTGTAGNTLFLVKMNRGSELNCEVRLVEGGRGYITNKTGMAEKKMKRIR